MENENPRISDMANNSMKVVRSFDGVAAGKSAGRFHVFEVSGCRRVSAERISREWLPFGSS